MQFDPNYLTKLASSLTQSSSVESTLTTQLSSGLRVTSPSIDPLAAAQASRIGSAIARDDSYVQAATGKQAALQAADSTLAEVVKQITSALSIAVQGSSGTQNTANTQTVAQQLSGIRDAVVSLANTSYSGQYLFAGSQQGVLKPYLIDTSTTPATITYNGDDKTQSITTPQGQSVQVSLPGSSIFGGSTGSGASGVLSALNQLVADFSSGTVSSTVSDDISSLTGALTQFSSQRSLLDSSLSRLQSSSTYSQTDEASLKAQQSSLVSADYTTVATQLQAAETQHQALLSVFAALGSTNLFTYLK